MTTKRDIKLTENDIGYEEYKETIIAAIEEARKELQACSDYFETVNEPVLIDYAIYKEAAAKSKYAYLISQARMLKIKVSGFNASIDKENVD